jgi:hypothetical protein
MVGHHRRQTGTLLMKVFYRDFEPTSQEMFRCGHLCREWAARYLQLFDEMDCAIALRRAKEGRFFFEWLAAIRIFEESGFLSLVTKYQFPKHERKFEVMRRVLPPAVADFLIRRPGFGPKQQGPDLLCYLPDASGWFFCEVKAPRDRFSEPQRRFFRKLETVCGKEIRIIKFVAVE